MPRTFIAVPIEPPPLLRKLLTRLNVLGGGLKPLPPDNLHVTLKFLGDTDKKLLPEIGDILRKSVGSMTPACDVPLVGVGVFPNPRRPTVLWVGLQDDGVLARLAAELEAALEPLGFPREARPFQPHLTLLRIKSRPPDALFELLTELASAEFGTTHINSVQLYESKLRPDGARYTVLESVGLIMP